MFHPHRCFHLLIKCLVRTVWICIEQGWLDRLTLVLCEFCWGGITYIFRIFLACDHSKLPGQFHPSPTSDDAVIGFERPHDFVPQGQSNSPYGSLTGVFTCCIIRPLLRTVWMYSACGLLTTTSVRVGVVKFTTENYIPVSQITVLKHTTSLRQHTHN